MKQKLWKKRDENAKNWKLIDENEIQIENINGEIQKLNDEIEVLKKRNDKGVSNLES